MQGLMQDFPLTLQHLLWRAEKLFRRKEIVSKTREASIATRMATSSGE